MSACSRRGCLEGGLALAGLGLLAGYGGTPFAAWGTRLVPTVGYVGPGNPPATGPNPNYEAFVGDSASSAGSMGTRSHSRPG